MTDVLVKKKRNSDTATYTGETPCEDEEIRVMHRSWEMPKTESTETETRGEIWKSFLSHSPQKEANDLTP